MGFEQSVSLRPESLGILWFHKGHCSGRDKPPNLSRQRKRQILRRMATEVPIFKSKDRNYLGNCKLISLTSSVCRSLEQALKKKIN